MSIRYTLRRLNGSECTIDNLKNYELAVNTTTGNVVFRLNNNIIDLTEGTINAAYLWAVSEQSPNNESDSRSPTGKTMSARSWALAMIDEANGVLDEVNDVADTIDDKLSDADDKIDEANDKIEEATTLLNRLIDITDADEVRY